MKDVFWRVPSEGRILGKVQLRIEGLSEPSGLHIIVGPSVAVMTAREPKGYNCEK